MNPVLAAFGSNVSFSQREFELAYAMVFGVQTATDPWSDPATCTRVMELQREVNTVRLHAMCQRDPFLAETVATARQALAEANESQDRDTLPCDAPEFESGVRSVRVAA